MNERITRLLITAVMVCSLVASASPYSGGDGSAQTPYRISTAADWVELTSRPGDWDKQFILTADIDLAGFELSPVAPHTNPDVEMFEGTVFSGCFDGQGYTVSNAVIDRPDTNFIALFGCVGNGGRIQNLRVDNVQMTGRRYVAGLVAGNGHAPSDPVSGTISNCHVTGVVIGTFGGQALVGGLCGDNFYGTITQCSAAVSVIGGDDISALGGLCAWNFWGVIRDSYATGSVSGGANSSQIGGFCGYTWNGEIVNCYAQGDVTGHRNIGGFIGENNSGTITGSYSTGRPTGSQFVGGFSGRSNNFYSSRINLWDVQTSHLEISYDATGKTTAQMKRLMTYLMAGWDISDKSSDPAVWRLPAGEYPVLAWQRYSGGSGTAGNPYQLGSVEDWLQLIDTPEDWNKHFILINDIDFAGMSISPIAPDIDPDTAGFQGVRFTGSINGQNYVLAHAVIDLPDHDFVGLIGGLGQGGQLIDLFVSNIRVTGRSRVGGLCGQNAGGMIRSCYTSGYVTGTTTSPTASGGLVGIVVLDGLVEYSGSSCTVTGVNRIGGLIGQLASGLINRCYAAGQVNAAGEDVGGLVGLIYDASSPGTIRNSYATGQVTGQAKVGGFVGNNFRGKIIHCYSTGKPVGSANVGGFCGTVNSDSGFEDTGNLWNTTTSQTSISAMGSGRNTNQFKSAYTFYAQGWDLFDICIWWMPDDSSPRLHWERNYSGGKGTEAAPYRMGKAADWQVLSSMVGHWDKHFVLICDIDFGENSLMPIGREFNPGGLDPELFSFTGVFDGNGYVLSNINIHLPHNHGLGGVFGHIDSALIKNLGVENISVTGFMFLGGLCGYNLSGTISNCYATGTVFGGNHVSHLGGLCGINTEGTITNCSADVSISGGDNADFMGGLCGSNLYGSIDRSYATGSVTGQGASEYLGGFCGHNSGTILNSYATGSITGSDMIGGFVGYFGYGSIINCYSTGRPIGFRSVGGFCGSLNPAANHEDVGNFWDMDRSQTETSAIGTGITTGAIKNPDTFISAGWDIGGAWWMPGGDDPQLAMQMRGYSGGKGTIIDPYRLSTVQDWQILQAMPEDWDKNFVLLSDIDFAGVELSPIAPDADPETIGFQGTMFTGSFDGQGHRLKNATINLPESDFVGLFGFLGNGGGLYNVGAENVNIAGYRVVGGLCGRNAGGDIIKCYTTGTVGGPMSELRVGGLVGVVNEGGIVSRCYSACTVTGQNNVGGLAGQLSGGHISESFATGQVTGTEMRIGGLVGFLYYETGMDAQSRIENCYATGRVIGGSHVGGLVGRIHDSTAYYCYATGKPTGTTTYVGGIFGSFQSSYSWGLFWDIQTSDTFYGGDQQIKGRPTAQMQTRSTFEDVWWNFDTVWAICEGTNYPRLQWQIPAADWVCPDGVGLEDMGYFSYRWLMADCQAPDHCDGADLNRDGVVDLNDLALFAGQWLTD